MPTREEVLNCKVETRKHVDNVRRLLHKVAFELIGRGEQHDASKFSEVEMEHYAETIPRLKDLTYGSDEYKKALKELGPALDHHYANNRHHPEHFADGVNDMTLIDLLEMFVDWKAATLKHNDGNLRKSIEINTKRFGIDAQLAKIFRNTVAEMDE
jgi:hypothetical protein